MLDITKPDEVEKWFEYPSAEHDERYLLRYTPPSKAKSYTDGALLHECLKNWEGVVSGGEPIPCSKDNREAFLESSAGAVRFMWMVRTACDISQFIETEALIKNLSRPHAGGARGLAQA